METGLFNFSIGGGRVELKSLTQSIFLKILAESLNHFAQAVEKMPVTQDNSNQTPSSAEARIPARTRRQAMDWSLVLASQGIQPVIEHTDDMGWALVVPAGEFETAVQNIRKYRTENLGWRWQKRIFKSGPLFDWASLGWIALTVVFYWQSGLHGLMRENGVMDVTAVTNGQWWRLFTATLLHGDVAHLASNAAFGLLLLGLAMGRYGTGVGLLAAFLAGVGGNVIDCLVYSEGLRSLGASGVVTGALGMLAVQSVPYLKHNPKGLKLVLAGLFGGVMLFVLLGLSPGTDVVAHLGGFACGLILGTLLSVVPKLTHKPIVNLIAGLVLAALIIWTWVLALENYR